MLCDGDGDGDGNVDRADERDRNLNLINFKKRVEVRCVLYPVLYFPRTYISIRYQIQK